MTTLDMERKIPRLSLKGRKIPINSARIIPDVKFNFAKTGRINSQIIMANRYHGAEPSESKSNLKACP